MTNAEEAEHTDVDTLSDAIDEGDWRRAGSLLDDLDASGLSDEEQAELTEIRELLAPDRAAIGVAVLLGLLFVAIVAALY